MSTRLLDLLAFRANVLEVPVTALPPGATMQRLNLTFSLAGALPLAVEAPLFIGLK